MDAGMPDEHKHGALADFSTALTGLAETAATSVAEIRVHHRSIATGLIWRPTLVVTSEEAIGRHETVSVASGGAVYPATILGRDPSTDIVLLRAERVGGTAAPLHSDLAPKAGEIAIAIGKREQGTVARLGIVSSSGEAWRSMRGGHIDRLIRLDLTLDRRGEGSLVLDAQGRGLGMAVRGPRRSVLVIPSATIERVAARILEKGSVRPGYLGLGLHPVRVNRPQDEPGFGLMVLSVALGGPGQAAGVLQGDIIVGWNGEPVRGMRGLMRKLAPDAVDSTVDLRVIRGGQELTLSGTIGSRPQR